MKNIPILPMLLLFLFVSCSKQKDDLNYPGDLVSQIANNRNYDLYQKLELKHMGAIVRADYELDAIHQLIISQPGSSVCDIPINLLLKLKGGVQYQEIHCEMYKLLTEIHRDFPAFKNLNSKEILEVYKAIHPEYELQKQEFAKPRILTN